MTHDVSVIEYLTAVVMCHLHTPSKVGRIVVIFIKKIFSLWLGQLKISFSKASINSGKTLGFWLSPNGTCCSMSIEPWALICRPGPGLGPECSVKKGYEPLEFAVFRLEALVPLIRNLYDNSRAQKEVRIVLINLSQMSSNIEQKKRLIDGDILQVHQHLLAKVLIQLKKLGPELNLNIYIYEQKELMGYKNSALFERLFLREK